MAEGFLPPALKSLAWQALGSASTVLAAVLVSWRLGLGAQGQFGFAKSWFDAAPAIAALGLPQGLLHLQYRLKVPAAALLNWLARRGFMAMGVSMLAACLLLLSGNRLAAAVVAALPFGIGYLIARSVLLAERGVVAFGVITALPALLTICGVILLAHAGRADVFDLLLLAVTITSGSISVALAWRSAGAPVERPWSRREVWSVSLQGWLQAALGALLPAGLLSVVAFLGTSNADLGAASLALHLYQLFVVAAGLLAPLLFDRLARQPEPKLDSVPWQVRSAAGCVVLMGCAGVAAAWFFSSQAWWLLPLSLMLLAGVAGMAARVTGTVLLARGAYAELSMQAAWRLLLSLILLFATTLGSLPAAAGVALALLAVEVGTWLRNRALVRSTRQP